ncbi:nitric oxide synthase oxygenase [Phaeodactylibacter luteus]|uniref:Nitric oxide synthase oxygenase n=1 Tax=Phaeodactylibacter luteus TaxID=1564516 RepID=A0A5C6RJR2_9BACT|nr:nitric oxide synthase oxygenase [Phaeodactylibacter luteus]TXB62184.1 nitric oxide synthase [Phaeodactylibacter luteus]
MAEASKFLRLFAKEQQHTEHWLGQRLANVAEELDETGAYRLTTEELAFGARVAWRNATRCIGRLYWKSLHVFDRRETTTAEGVFEALCEHLSFATNGGNIRSAISIFPEARRGKAPVTIHNHQLIRYAGYKDDATGLVIGDPASVGFTRFCEALGWKGNGTAHDILPLVVETAGHPPAWFEWPEAITLEVPIEHPTEPGITALGMKWYAVPVISDMRLEIGGISYPAAPFNGWYMGTEVGARNLADAGRYDMLPKVAAALGLDTAHHFTLWKDRALLELNTAVLHSFRENGVKMVDHHTAAEQHEHFERIECRHGRKVTGEWAWLIPPMSPAATSIFHKEYDATVLKPNFFYPEKEARGCPWSMG